MLVTLVLANKTVNGFSPVLQDIFLSHIILTLCALPFFWIKSFCVLDEKYASHSPSECRNT